MSERFLYGQFGLLPEYLFNYVRPNLHYVNGEIAKVDYPCIPCAFPQIEMFIPDSPTGLPDMHTGTYESLEMIFNVASCSWFAFVNLEEMCPELDQVCSFTPHPILFLDPSCSPINNSTNSPPEDPVLEDWSLLWRFACCNQSEFDGFGDPLGDFCFTPAGPGFVTEGTLLYDNKDCEDCTEWRGPVQITVFTNPLPPQEPVEINCGVFWFRICGPPDCTCQQVETILENACNTFDLLENPEPLEEVSVTHLPPIHTCSCQPKLIFDENGVLNRLVHSRDCPYYSKPKKVEKGKKLCPPGRT